MMWFKHISRPHARGTRFNILGPVMTLVSKSAFISAICRDDAKYKCHLAGCRDGQPLCRSKKPTVAYKGPT